MNRLAPNVCNVCPRKCRKNTQEQKGFCGIHSGIVLSKSLVHHGEEPVFSKDTGVGNFFFTACNLSCVYCQNYQISQLRKGEYISESKFIELMFKFQDKNCAFIGLVSPSHQSPWIRRAVEKAKQSGLKVPFIYNSAAYDDLEHLKMWEGLIDVYLPDIRYSNNAIASRYSSAINYVDISRDAVAEMYRQVGNPQFDTTEEHIISGLWVRHLVLPNALAGSWETLCFLALELSTNIGLSLMSQYNPLYRAREFEELSRCITQQEYDAVVSMSESLGFRRVFRQDLKTSPHYYVPDFDRADPFD